MRMLVFSDGRAATLVAEGSPEEAGMRELPHMKCEAWRECASKEEGEAWFWSWVQINLGADSGRNVFVEQG